MSFSNSKQNVDDIWDDFFKRMVSLETDCMNFVKNAAEENSKIKKIEDDIEFQEMFNSAKTNESRFRIIWEYKSIHEFLKTRVQHNDYSFKYNKVGASFNQLHLII